MLARGFASLGHPRFALFEEVVLVTASVYDGGRWFVKIYQNMDARIKYPEVEDWYDSLDEDGRQRVDQFLVENYGN
jgi:hypothetical protein